MSFNTKLVAVVLTELVSFYDMHISWDGYKVISVYICNDYRDDYFEI